MMSSTYANRPVTKPPDWHGLVAWDLLCNNLATGTFLVAALGELAAPRVFTAVANLAYPLALALLLLDLFLLVLDLGDPWRFHHMMRIFKPSSPMSLGTWSLAAFSLPLTVLVATEVVPGDHAILAWVRLCAIVLGLAPALASAVYKGVLLSTTSQPGWTAARWLGAYLTSSAFLLGAAVLLLLSLLLDQPGAAARLYSTMLLLLAFNTLMLALLLRNIGPALRRRFSTGELLGMTVASLLLGHLLPALLLDLRLAGANSFLLAAAIISLLVGSVVIRFVIVHMPHQAPSEQRLR
jgi:hypothetical protein